MRMTQHPVIAVTCHSHESGHARVREVLPDGIIENVIGGGTERMGRRALLARDVNLNLGGEVFGH
jgi:hypothetical protein